MVVSNDDEGYGSSSKDLAAVLMIILKRCPVI